MQLYSNSGVFRTMAFNQGDYFKKSNTNCRFREMDIAPMLHFTIREPDM